MDDSAGQRSLSGQTALVTGAGRGIGAAIASRLASCGAAVAIADVLPDAATELAEELSSAGHQAASMVVDVSDGDSFSAAVRTTVDRFGDLTLLVNNAGITRPKMLHRMTDDDWDSVHDVILRGTFNGLRAVAPRFRDPAYRRPRRVVNISSVAYHGGVGGANYSAAKAGVVGLTRAAADEWARSEVTVNAVAPGLIDVGLSKGIPAETRDQIIARIPVGRAGTAEDVAAAVAFFCSPDAGFVTGQVLDVDGGMPDMRPA